MKQSLKDLLEDLSILAGEKLGPSDASWQDVAGTAAINARHLASLLDSARKGNHEPFICFPSITDVMENQ
jgi:hypothetical protein